MPRSFRGRQQGRHRRPKTLHVPAAIGLLAVATAATGALTAGGASARTLSSGGSSLSLEALGRDALGGSVLLTATERAEAMSLRAQDVVERSAQRDQLVTAAASTQAQAALDAQQALDEITAERAARVPAVLPPTWVVPVAGYRITSQFGPRWGGMHAGLDLAAPSGTPIRAMGDGEIVEAAYSGGYGNRIIVRHADGTETWYCHQSAFELTSGPVTAGEIIGYVGSTGNSTGPHLHLEVHPGAGDAIDPMPWITGLGLTL